MGSYEALCKAVESGEVLTVIYHGGSQPGTKRQLSPIKVTEREVRARDVSTGDVKTFLLAKMEVVEVNSKAEAYVPGAVVEPEFSSLMDALSDRRPELDALGWHVQLSESAATVHGLFKNGSPKKGATAGILKHEESANRPWYVFGPDLAAARTFSNLVKAVELFLEQARKYGLGNTSSRGTK